ncbi:MAG TPA: hypothetical protein VF753_05035 [Terriglobales bacterium]
MKRTIQQVELQAAQELDAPVKQFLQSHYPVPTQSHITVSLFDASGRKKRRSASTDNWSPEGGEIRIRFEPASVKQLVSAMTQPQPSPSPERRASQYPGAPAEAKLIRALDHAESTPGWTFVSLKRFRDEILPLEPFEPGEAKLTDLEWQQLLNRAIEKRLILTSRVPNPKSPQFPVTTIRLNRLMPEVKTVLGTEDSGDLDFRPVEIKGEPLSTTIIRARHR